MTNILAGLVASTLSFIANRFIFSKLGLWTVIYLIPWSEELFKTVLAYHLGSDLIVTHSIFGLLEASLDLFNNNNLAAVLALLTHLFFGILTFYFWRWSNNLIVSIAVVALVHTAWNYLIRRLDHEINL
mgnify:FL=1